MTYVEAYALPTGKLYLPDRWLFEDGNNDMLGARQFSPDFSFLISHPSGQNVLFDLGLRKVITDKYLQYHWLIHTGIREQPNSDQKRLSLY